MDIWGPDYMFFRHGTSSTDPLEGLDLLRFQLACEPTSMAPTARLQQRPLSAHSLVERHSTAPIAAVLPED
jgi:hypothetical protein